MAADASVQSTTKSDELGSDADKVVLPLLMVQAEGVTLISEALLGSGVVSEKDIVTTAVLDGAVPNNGNVGPLYVYVVVCAMPAKAPNVVRQMTEMTVALIFMWIL
jgi:hypothetical protein